jgi:hypothetical protein
MEILLAVAVLAVLLLPAGLLRAVPSSLGWAPDGSQWAEPVEALDDAPGVLDDADVDGGLLTLPFVRRRLDILADEIAHLDDDPGILARAFRKTVALAAYEALRADETRLAQMPTLHVEAALGFEMVDEPAGAYQEWAR